MIGLIVYPMTFDEFILISASSDEGALFMLILMLIFFSYVFFI